jgi:hypothetical protein
MSHFTVLVIGNDPEEQLEPFSEHLDVDPIETGLASDVDILSFRNHYTTVNLEDKRTDLTEEIVAENKKLTFEQLYDKYGDDWNGKIWQENAEGKLVEMSTYNPDSKWDWYQLGGRWGDFLKLKKGRKGEKGDGGLFGHTSNKRGWCDQALKKDIDFDGMKDAAGKEAEKTYKNVQKIFGGTIPKIEHTWDEVRDTLELTKDMTIDQKRNFYHNQPAVVESKKHNEKLGWGFSLEPFQVTIEEYIQEARNHALDVHAVLVDGEWHESGEMGWFAMVHNENPNWDDEFKALIESIDGDTLVSLYDCHI